MREDLKTYRLELETMSPLFIGDGQSLQKKEYIRKGRLLYIPDLRLMCQGLSDLNLLDAYEDFMLKQNMGLGEWLAKQRVSEKEYKKWIRYVLDCGDVSIERGGQLQILTFVKDPYGCPYVPGSSVKGLLRTILMGAKLLNEEGRYAGEKNEVKVEAKNFRAKRTQYLSKQTQKLEIQVFRTMERFQARPADQKNAVNDIMSCLRVSDSRPLAIEDLTVCQKLDMGLNGTMKSLNLLRECIRPNTKIVFDLAIQEGFPYTIQKIRAAIKQFAQSYYDSFYKIFRKINKDLVLPKVNYVWLGGGVGYPSKTVVYQLMGREQGLRTVSDILQKTVNNPQHGHQRDVQKGVSPHTLKCTKYRGKTYEFGQCALRILEAKS